MGVNTATLNGSVNPNGIEATYHFEYGTTTAYGLTTYPGDAGTGKINEPESYPVSGLSPYTTYHYRLVATSATGTSVGGDKTFTTEALPPEVSTGSASAVLHHQATLTGSVDPEGVSTHYYFEYGETASYGSATPVPPGGEVGGGSLVPVTATANGLEAGVT